MSPPTCEAPAAGTTSEPLSSMSSGDWSATEARRKRSTVLPSSWPSRRSIGGPPSGPAPASSGVWVPLRPNGEGFDTLPWDRDPRAPAFGDRPSTLRFRRGPDVGVHLHGPGLNVRTGL